MFAPATGAGAGARGGLRRQALGLGFPAREFVDCVAELDFQRIEIVLAHDREQLAQRLRFLGVPFFHLAARFYEELDKDFRGREWEPAVAAELEIAQHRLAAFELLRADDQRVTGAIAIGDLEMGEQLAFLIVHERRRFEPAPQLAAIGAKSVRACVPSAIG